MSKGNGVPCLHVKDKQSLIHLGSLDSFDITEGGKKAAGIILDYIDGNGEAEDLEEAVRTYEELIPNENFGGEYTSLEWFCNYLLSPDDKKEEMRREPLMDSFICLLTENDYDDLRTYLLYKYHFREYGEGDQRDLRARMRFLEDFILFCNPARDRWEKTRDNLERVNLKEGIHIADLGCGPGYYTFRFANIIGDSGRVYAIETNPLHLDYLRDYVARYGVSNVEIVEGSFEGIGLPSGIKVDAVFICSLYHNIYAAFTDEERDSFIHGLREALRDDGMLIIVDNDLVEEGELPYHGPYIHKDMLVSQLHFYGFRLLDSFQFSPQRFLLRFGKEDLNEAGPLVEGGDVPITDIPVLSKASLVRYRIIGTATSGYTAGGKKCGRRFYEGLVSGGETALREAYGMFEALYTKERVGDDYTALMWFIRYALASMEEQGKMTEDPFVRYYAEFFAGNDFERLKKYLYYKFHLELPDPVGGNPSTNYEYNGRDFPINTLNDWNEFLIFNNPNRFLWERTEEMISLLGLREGMCVADVGCGGGAFTIRFSRLVGPEGRVYATEINKDALFHLESYLNEAGKESNVHPVIAKMNDISLPEDSLDMVFMCSMYHAVYITDIEFVKDAFIASLRRALRKDGRLVIVDNAITGKGVPSYYGPGIDRRLIIAQLKYYGFRLVFSESLIPQRYVLIFSKEPDADDS